MHRSVSCISTARHGTAQARPRIPRHCHYSSWLWPWRAGRMDARARRRRRRGRRHSCRTGLAARPAHYFPTVRYRTPAQLALQSPPLQLQCTSATHSRSDRSPTATPTHACIHREKTLSHVRTYVPVSQKAFAKLCRYHQRT